MPRWLRKFLETALLAFCLVQPATADLVVVVNARNNVSTLTRAEVINIFFGRYRQFFNGQEAQPVDVLDSHPDRARFYAALAGKTPAEVDAYWSRQVFAGHTRPPPRVNSTEEVLKWVASHAGGIGYVDLPKADARVKVVFELKP